jgi:DNA-binding NarL/FixJ family response regulator
VRSEQCFAGLSTAKAGARRYLDDVMKDAVAIVEAAYVLEGDDRAWLTQLTAAAAPILDAGFGIVSYFYDLRRPASEHLEGPVTVNADLAYARAIAAVHVRRAAGDRVRPYLRPASARTSSEIYGTGVIGRDPGAREAATYGIADLMRVCVVAGDRHGCFLGAPLPRVSRVDRASAARWAKVAAHIAAGLRLRRSLAHAHVDAILDTRGHVEHLDPSVSPSALDQLRMAAVVIDRARERRTRRDPDAALSLWRSLVAGRWSLVDHFDSDGRRYRIARRNAPGAADPRGLTAQEQEVARLVALGHSNKLIANELGVAEGTVAAHVAAIRRKLGAQSRTTLASLLTVPSDARVARVTVGGESLAVLSERRAANVLGVILTPAEHAVALAVANGASNAEVARQRGTSIHTVVNQLQQIYQKLGVRSRVELDAKLRA